MTDLVQHLPSEVPNILSHAGRPRLYVSGILMTVRAMYFDIHAWAVHEPERWAEWSVPCPIPRSDLRSITKRKRIGCVSAPMARFGYRSRSCLSWSIMSKPIKQNCRPSCTAPAERSQRALRG